MLDRAMFILTFVAAVSSGLVAGIFFAFSTFVMAALGRLPPEQGIAAMNSINITVINPLFMLAFMGTGVLCLVLAGASYLRWDHAGGKLILLASLLYVIGCVGVTMSFNVPLNDALAAVKTATPDGIALWSEYLRTWTFWNHVRTVAPLISAILFTLALN